MELETNLTRGSIGSARAVLDTLKHNPHFDEDQRAALFYAEAILYDLLREEPLNPPRHEGRAIPIPEDAIESDEAARLIAEWAHGDSFK